MLSGPPVHVYLGNLMRNKLATCSVCCTSSISPLTPPHAAAMGSQLCILDE